MIADIQLVQRHREAAVPVRGPVVALSADHQFGPHSDARENLAAGLNNWAVEHCRRERYDLAAPLIAQGLEIEPTFAPLVANERLVRDRFAKRGE